MKTKQKLLQICLLGAMLLLPAVVQAQFTFTTNKGAITITGYAGSNSVVVIPDMTNGYPVVNIANYVFQHNANLVTVTIPHTITNIGTSAFSSCAKLGSVMIPNSVISIGDGAFTLCGFTNVTIPNSVTNIGVDCFTACPNLKSVTICDDTAVGGCATTIKDDAFCYCTNLNRVIIGKGVAQLRDGVFEECYLLTTVIVSSNVVNMGYQTFRNCSSLTGVYFKGNPPACDIYNFLNANQAVVYYLPGTTGWNTTYGSRPTVLWNPQAQAGDGSFGVLTNQFDFNITGSSNLVIVVEGCTDFNNPTWTPISTNKLNTFIGTNGTSYFSDPQWANYSGRFYRLRSP
jgi:hypothetical protein